MLTKYIFSTTSVGVPRSGFAFWYSAASFLNALSSRALHPTQTVSFVAPADRCVPAPDAVPTAASMSAINVAAVATRFIRNLLLPKWCSLDTFTR